MAEATAGPVKKKGMSTVVMMGVFLFVMLIMFDNNLRILTGNIVGAAFNPVARLWGFEPVWTVLFAGVIMILATTAIRHFLVDWVQMAKVQEVMRTFQKEFASARKSSNTYQMKRLTDMQPEVMKMQADMSTEQLKPMAFTMLLVIPIFAWLSTVTAAGIVYAPAFDGASENPIFVAVAPDVQEALLLQPNGEEIELFRGVNAYTIAPPGAGALTGTVRLTHPITDEVKRLDLSKAVRPDWEALKVGTLAAGQWSIRPEGDANIRYMVGDEEHTSRSHVIVAVPTGGGEPQVVFVNGGGIDSRKENPLVLASESDIYALIPFEQGRAPVGGVVDYVRPFVAGAPSDAGVVTWEVAVESKAVLVDADAAHARLVPHRATLPWNAASDLNGSWGFLPHWILLYSLFSIPFGQITQKLLKMWEYSKVDLDNDGKAPGLAG